MTWLNDLIFGTSVGHSIMLLSICIVVGILLGRIKVFGISLGITFVLFVGILLGHFGITMDPEVLHFMKEFGLILFVFSVGMQVGPGFFSSFKQGGITLNLLATGVVLLGVLTTIILYLVTGLPMQTMVGILSGAVTNTPGLGAAQTAFADMHNGVGDNTIALGYAVCYPLGVIGIILAIMLIRFIFRINFKKEQAELDSHDNTSASQAKPLSLEVHNPAIFKHTVGEVSKLLEGHEFVVSRVLHKNDKMEIATHDTILDEGDVIFIVTIDADVEAIATMVGNIVKHERKEWDIERYFVSRRLIVTNNDLNGKRLRDINLRKTYHVNITRINRSGVDLVARPNLILQMGDRLTVVGNESDVQKAEAVIGNSIKRLNQPNLVTIFLGIFLGVFIGCIPMTFPGVPQPVKLGLAGGPLIVAILISRFGYKYHLITYSTLSANLMIREIGITMFLACVGVGAGDGFVETIANGGYQWIGYGFLITFLPLMIIGIIGLKACKVNYFILMGLLAGSMTDPPALAYSNGVAGNDAPSVGYATVYPLTMFLRVLTAQMLVLFFC